MRTVLALIKKDACGLRAVSKADKSVYLTVKRWFDVGFSILLLIAFSPLMLAAAVAIRVSSPGPVIYRHRRVGKQGRPIEILKFRTMVNHADEMLNLFTQEQQQEWERNFKVVHDPRVTGIGRLLRAASLDELPQLINVIRGDLSLVGPRPIVPEELALYGKNGARLLSVTPGLTGYWQVYARQGCTYSQRMKMELDYVENMNPGWDIRILLQTVPRVIRGKGAK